jgi:hypothetical protein
MTMRLTHSTVVEGTGPMTLGELRHALEFEGVPDSASVTISTYAGNQMDPSSWTLTFRW